MSQKMMTQRVPAEVFPPGELIREELEARGWTQTDLAEILGRPLKLVNDIILGKRTITLKQPRVSVMPSVLILSFF